MSKRRSWAQDNQFRLVPIFLVRYTSIKQSFKDNHLSSVIAIIPNVYWKWPKCHQRRPRHFCAACFATSANICFGHIRKFLYKEPFKNTTWPWWPLYIGPQDGSIIQVWLYISIKSPQNITQTHDQFHYEYDIRWPELHKTWYISIFIPGPKIICNSHHIFSTIQLICHNISYQQL